MMGATVLRVNNPGTRLTVAVLVGLAVVIFGVQGSQGEGVSPAIGVLAIVAALLTWNALKPKTGGGK